MAITARFLIRFAWHCAGTYRTTDGRGGCDGARIRFDPERSWGDNADLIPGSPHNSGDLTAMELLTPIKFKYGNNLSWGDLIVLAGNTAIEEMNGPQIDFCAGRVDAYEGYTNEELDVNKIYVNAGNTSAAEVREIFHKMGFNDQETVAIIGGGHTFGRCHASRSGFSGPWTSNPSEFDNQYFQLLTGVTFTEDDTVPGQFFDMSRKFLMLHGDVVLLDDPIFLEYVNKYATNETAFYWDFKFAWEKLMNRGNGNRPCAGQLVEVPNLDIDYEAVKADVLAVLPSPKPIGGTYGPLMVRLAWHCAGTYRETDHLGGCNGARIRFEPEIKWGSNTDVQIALDLLEPIQRKYDGLSWADLIVIAGSTALESMGSLPMPFCPGRVDVTAEEAEIGSQYLDPEIYLDPETATAPRLRESMKIMGFTDREMVVLNGGGHSIGRCHHFRSGFQGPWTHNPTEVSNSFFQLLLENHWEEVEVPQTGKKQFRDTETGQLMMLFSDMVFRDDPKFRAIVEEYAQDNDLFLREFRDAWVKLMNGDRFGGVCLTSETSAMPKMPEDMMAPSKITCPDSKTSGATWAILATCIVSVLLLISFLAYYILTGKRLEELMLKRSSTFGSGIMEKRHPKIELEDVESKVGGGNFRD